MIRVLVPLLLWTTPPALADDALNRCLSAKALGLQEGEALFHLSIRGHEKCSRITTEPLFFWHEAHTARLFLWEIGAFPAFDGLEAEQPCRVEGQNLGIDVAQRYLLTTCASQGAES